MGDAQIKNLQYCNKFLFYKKFRRVLTLVSYKALLHYFNIFYKNSFFSYSYFYYKIIYNRFFNNKNMINSFYHKFYKTPILYSYNKNSRTCVCNRYIRRLFIKTHLYEAPTRHFTVRRLVLRKKHSYRLIQSFNSRVQRQVLISHVGLLKNFINNNINFSIKILFMLSLKLLNINQNQSNIGIKNIMKLLILYQNTLIRQESSNISKKLNLMFITGFYSTRFIRSWSTHHYTRSTSKNNQRFSYVQMRTFKFLRMYFSYRAERGLKRKYRTMFFGNNIQQLFKYLVLPTGVIGRAINYQNANYVSPVDFTNNKSKNWLYTHYIFKFADFVIMDVDIYIYYYLTGLFKFSNWFCYDSVKLSANLPVVWNLWIFEYSRLYKNYDFFMIYAKY